MKESIRLDAAEVATRAERERIIKLLEEAKTWLEDYDVDELINQIKGENK